jgi:two-component system, sensor histidine kinase PdtaS
MKIITPQTDFIDNQNDKSKYILIWRLSLFLTLLFSVASILTFTVDFYTSLLYIISFLVCLFCFVFLNIKHKITPIFWIFSVSASVVVTVSMQTLMGTLHYPDFIWAIATIVFAYIGLGKKIGVVFLIFHLISITVFFTYTINLHLESLKIIPFAQKISVMFEMFTAFFALSYLIQQYLVFQSNTEKKLLEVNKELNIKNEEITLLMKEIHHRVKNNLQLVVSLLRMQRNEIESEEIKTHFTDAINRIMSISVIHQKLYQQEDLKNFNFEAYINDLILEIKSMNDIHSNISIELSIDIKDIGLKTLVPLGLLLNELISNSFKHAFSSTNEDSKKEININIDQCSVEKICVYYEDSGIWKEEINKGFGLELVDLLTSQMEGTKEKIASKYKFKLQNLDLE